MQILRAENYRRMKWKNGGGETAEIAVFPGDAALDAFGWRISMASVAADGPFSAFPGVDRTLSVLDGAGIVLDIEGRGQVTLGTDAPPQAFPADAPTTAVLVDGPITDLNVMTRRGRYSHKVTRQSLGGTVDLNAQGETIVVFCQAGRAALETVGSRAEFGRFELGRFDAAICEDGHDLRLHGEGEFLFVLIGKD